MEKIQFGTKGDRYNIESIQPVAVHVMRIVFTGTVPDVTLFSEPITIYSQGDVKETTLTEWTTVYYYDFDNRTVYLSDDGSVYTEPEETEPEPQTEEPEPYEPSIEELKAGKISEMKAACDKAEDEGTAVTLSDGSVEHFSLTLDNYIDIMLRQFKINSGASEIDFHADGEPSRYYSAEDMQTIINAAYDFIDYQKTYCNELCLWIEALENAEEIEAVTYGMDIPVDHRSEVLEKMLPVGDDETGMLPQEGKDDDDDADDDGNDNDSNDNTGGSFDDDSSVDVANTDDDPADDPEPGDDGEDD